MEASQESTQFQSGDLQLEGVLHRPPGDGPFPGLVVCHPHPLYGGDMSNNVVLAVCRAMTDVSIAAMRFNFRGVGKSAGSFSQGIGEQQDVMAALTFLSSLDYIDSARVGLAGYSFGAAVSLPVSLQDDHVQALALVSPPFSTSEWESIQSHSEPTLILGGTEDEFFVPPKSLPSQCECGLIPGADHFWWGQEGILKSRISAFFSTAFGLHG
jgi:alpha/beta superfamily hydrolase